MSILDKIVAAATPPETEEERRQARERSREIATGCPWLQQVLDHHLEIDRAFAKAQSARDPESRRSALKELGTLITGHAIAEEAAIYPHLAMHDQKAHATMAYAEQSGAKMELGMLEALDPDSQDWLDKLEHIKGAVEHHVYQEEGTWFPELVGAIPESHNAMIAARYDEEYRRYSGSDSAGAARMDHGTPAGGMLDSGLGGDPAKGDLTPGQAT